MERELAQATAEKLEQDKRVRNAEVDENHIGILVRAEARDREAARDLKSDLHEYPVYVEVIA